MNAEPDGHARWRMLAVAYVGIVAFAVVFQSLSPVLDLMIADAGISHGQAGALMSCFALPGILFSIPAGVLSDRYGARKVGLASLLLMTAGSLLTAVSSGFVALAAGRLIAGTGAFTLTVTLTQLIAVWFKGRELGFAMGVYNTGMPLGTVLTLNTLGAVGRAYTWHAALAAAVAVSAAALAFFFGVARVPASGTAPERRRPRSSVAGLGQGVWLVGASWLWINAAGISYLTFGTDYFLSRGESAASAGMLTSFLMMGSLFLSPAAGFMLDRGWSQRALIIVGSLCLSIIYLLILCMPGSAYLLTILLGVAAALVPVSIFSLPGRLLPLERVGAGFGIISACLNVGIMVGPCLVGIARDVVGGYQTGFLMMSFFSLMSAASIFFLKMDRKG